MVQVYGNGTTALGANQINQHAYERKALIEAVQESYFGQLADTKNMPKNQGKAVKQYRYMPVVDDRNLNSMGLDASGVVYANGNIYGSSTDVGVVTTKFPVLGETGGRVNRVGLTRVELVSNLQKFGFFWEYSADLERFDTDAELMTHANRELMNGAIKVYEDKLQIDLLNNAGLVKYAGTATSVATLSGATNSELTYADLVKLGIDLDKNRTPKQTKIITGTRMIDTMTIPDCRVAHVGSELVPTLEAMKDFHNERAFIPAHKYASGTTLLKGEIGRVAGFRIVLVPNMMKWAGAGANGASASYYQTAGRHDVFPFLVVGDESFTSIGFQTDGKSQKFTTIHKKPSIDTADKSDPYGETGFSSIKWFYGFMPQYIERLAVIKCVAKM